MLKNYELLYIIHPDLEGSSEKVTEKVAGFIKKDGGEVKSQEDWGKRKLAYKIAKNDFGVYVLVYFATDSSNLPKIERDLKLSEEIVRSMITVLPEIKESTKAKKKAKKETKSETPKVETTKKEDVVVEEKAEEQKAEETPAEAPKAKKTTKKTEEKAEKKPAKKEKTEDDKAKDEERLKKLDEKLDELLK